MVLFNLKWSLWRGGGASEAGTVGPAPQPSGGTAVGGAGGDGFVNLITGVACSAYAGGGVGGGNKVHQLQDL